MAVEPRRIAGRPAPLFERLGGAAGAPAAPVHDLDALAASVERSLCDLLATRAPARAGTVMAYGVPDTLAFAPGDPQARVALAERIAAAVGRFEPRLAVTAVRIDADPARAGGASCRIEGDLRHGRVTRTVGFHLDLDDARPRVDAD